MAIVGVPPLDEIAKYNSAAQQQQDDDGGADGGAGGGAANALSKLMAALPADSSMPKAQFEKGDKVS